jgi:hypothetical protein
MRARRRSAFGACQVAAQARTVSRTVHGHISVQAESVASGQPSGAAQVELSSEGGRPGGRRAAEPVGREEAATRTARQARTTMERWLAAATRCRYSVPLLGAATRCRYSVPLLGAATRCGCLGSDSSTSSNTRSVGDREFASLRVPRRIRTHWRTRLGRTVEYLNGPARPTHNDTHRETTDGTRSDTHHATHRLTHGLTHILTDLLTHGLTHNSPNRVTFAH